MPTPHRVPPTGRLLLRRLLFHLALSLVLLTASLAVGMWGYGHYEHLPWRDAFLNSAMLLGGMGPVKQDLSESGKVFAGLYALYSGVLFLVIAGLVLAPVLHRVLHYFHLATDDEKAAD